MQSVGGFADQGKVQGLAGFLQVLHEYLAKHLAIVLAEAG